MESDHIIQKCARNGPQKAEKCDFQEIKRIIYHNKIRNRTVSSGFNTIKNVVRT